MCPAVLGKPFFCVDGWSLNGTCRLFTCLTTYQADNLLTHGTVELLDW